MKSICYILLIFSFFACSKGNQLVEKANEISGRIKLEYAPDSREAIYTTNFSIDKNGNLVVSGETSLPEAKLALVSGLEALNVHLVDSLAMLPKTDLGEKVWGLINLSVVNLRANPRHSAELVSQAIMGTPVKILKKKYSWYLIQTPDRYIAWVDAAALHRLTPNEMKDWRKAKRYVFLPHFQEVKDADGNAFVSDLVVGAILEFEKESKQYLNLLLPDGRRIRVQKSMCQEFDAWKNQKIKDASELTQTAREFMGRPYLWGGTSSKAVDCSGFVKTVYFIHGIILARDASLQFLHGQGISPEQGYRQLKEGDLIFFGRKKSKDQAQKVTHVGMYIQNGEFIHSSGRVKLNSFDPEADNYSNYRSVSWLGGRRVLQRIGEPGIVRVADHEWY